MEVWGEAGASSNGFRHISIVFGLPRLTLWGFKINIQYIVRKNIQGRVPSTTETIVGKYMVE